MSGSSMFFNNYNRAVFDTASINEAIGVLPLSDRIRSVLSAITPLHFWEVNRTNEAGIDELFTAAGISVDLNPRNRFRALANAFTGNTDLAKFWTKVSPSLTIGGGIAYPNSNETLTFAGGTIKTPDFLQASLESWQRSLRFDGKSPIVGFELPSLNGSINESHSNISEIGHSSIDTDAIISGEINITLIGGNIISGSLSYHNSQKTVPLVVDGKVSLIVVESTSWKVEISSSALQVAGLPLEWSEKSYNGATAYDLNSKENYEVQAIGNQARILDQDVNVDLGQNPIIVRGRPSEKIINFNDGRSANLGTGTRTISSPEGDLVVRSSRTSNGATTAILTHPDGSKEFSIIGAGDVNSSPLVLQGSLLDDQISLFGQPVDADSELGKILKVNLKDNEGRVSELTYDSGVVRLGIANQAKNMTRDQNLPADIKYEFKPGVGFVKTEIGSGRFVQINYRLNGEGKLLDKNGLIVDDVSRLRTH